MKHFIHYGIVIATLCASAAASDWYVDSVHGDNANSGTSPGDAWKSIDFALSSTPAGPQTIHVLPGTYTAASGEFFPVSVRPEQVLVGEAGPAATVIDVGAALNTAISFSTGTLGPSTRIEGLSIRGGAIGVRISNGTTGLGPTLRNLDIADAQVGVSIQHSDALLEHVDVHDCITGLHCTSSASSGSYFVTARDSSFSRSAHDGVFLLNGAWHLQFDRVAFERNTWNGVFATLQGTRPDGFANFVDCSFLRNGIAGWNGDDSYNFDVMSRYLLFRRCTVARNGGYGLLFYGDGFDVQDLATIDHSVVAGNPADIVMQFLGDAPTVIRSCVGDGSYINGLGSFAGDPLFADSINGDFRLRWDSPCIDYAVAPPPAGTLDLLGHPRDVDGDLDTNEKCDLGAFEFQPMELVGTGQLGSLLQWKLWGPQGNATKLYWTRVALPGTPTNTPFGQLDLDPFLASVFRTATVGSATPTVLQRSIPNAPALVGHTFAFQALTDNAAAPNGKAYTNAAQITITP